ncbi:hypothetical protein BKI52_32070 [marine bacterium AO1-C]|nr:hypothetical protein BKI52_32070 [marine bacterium AO1-C]
MKLLQKYITLGLLVGMLGFTACDSQQSGKETGTDTTSTAKTDSTKTDSTSKTEVVSNVKPDAALTAKAYLMAGLDIDDKGGMDALFTSPEGQEHIKLLSESWNQLDQNRLNKIRPWRDQEIGHLNKEQHNLFYPFSGPDFLNAFLYFPNCDNYLMFGLEPIGELPTFKADDKKFMKQYFYRSREALAELLKRNYFITSYMSGDLNTASLKGVLPLMSIFLARTGSKIVKVERIVFDTQGNRKIVPITVPTDKDRTLLHIEFIGKGKTKSQNIYYFGSDIQEKFVEKKKHFIDFIKSFDKKITLTKSASYLPHYEIFTTIRNIILDESSAVLQDDTGVPYSYYKKQGWNVQLYGKYARPVSDFKSGYQADLRNAFQTDKTVKKLDFTYGYHWKTDNTSLLFCQKPKK